MEDSTGAEDADIRRLRGKQLADLVSHWAPVYAITAEGGAWNARHRDDAEVTLRARSAGELRLMIRADHFRRTAPRHLVAVP